MDLSAKILFFYHYVALYKEIVFWVWSFRCMDRIFSLHAGVVRYLPLMLLVYVVYFLYYPVRNVFRVCSCMDYV